MKLFSSLWILVDNDSMDVTQIQSTTQSSEISQQPGDSQASVERRTNIININDYLKAKNPGLRKRQSL